MTTETNPMTDELTQEARDRAGNYFRQGYNCAETLFLTFRQYLAPDVEESLVRMATPFGGGLGHAGCICGALSGAIMMLGLKKGRISPQATRDEAYGLSREFQKRFMDEFGATCCRALNKNPFGTPEQGKNCLKIIGNTAKILMAFIQEKGLV
ncbi:MAG: C-GCAxxG-C-C family protein [Pseudomonadota bacterium]